MQYYDLKEMSVVDAHLQTNIEELQRKLDGFREHVPLHSVNSNTSGFGDDGEWESADIKDFVDRITSATIDALRASGKILVIMA